MPGAYISTQDPKFENDALVPEAERAPTVIASGQRAGIGRRELLEFPAATTLRIPSCLALVIASQRGLFSGFPIHPKLMLSIGMCFSRA